MTGRNNNTELSALLDGEVRGEQIERLSALLSSDAQLMNEFEEQRSIKTLLSQLPEYETPDFMATRVMGLIAEKQEQKKPRFNMGWRMLAAGAGGFALCMLSVGTYIIASNPGHEAATVVAESGSGAEVHPVGLSHSTDGLYTAQDWDNASVNNWRSIELPASAKGEVDERLEDFLRFAAEAHGYEMMVHSADTTATDMPEALLLMVGDDGGE